MTTGNTMATSSPSFSPTDSMVAACRRPVSASPARPARPDTALTSAGPEAQPTSPAKASMANMAVPPCGYPAAARENVPGHIMPTERPVMAQPTRERIGLGENTASR